MSTPMPWVKLYTETLDDFKLLDLDDGVKWRFVQLILLAGECDADGYLESGGEAISIKKIAMRLRVDLEQCKQDIAILTEAGLLSEDPDTGTLCVVKFSERQGRPQSVKREQWRERQKRYRDKQEDVTQVSPVTNPSREEKRREDKEKRREDIQPPPPSSQNIFKIYEREIGTITKNISDELSEAEKTYPNEWFEPAFAEASRQNKRSWAYVSAILKSWNTNGFKSLSGKPPNPNKVLTLEEEIKLIRRRDGLE